MKYYITACFDKALSEDEARKLNLSEYIINRKDDEIELPEFVYTSEIESTKPANILTNEVKEGIIDVVRANFCFLTVSTERNWRAFKC